MLSRKEYKTDNYTLCRLKRVAFLPILLSAFYSVSVKAQNTAGQQGLRVVTTAVPILTVSPDARSAGMGDAGVAISPDANTTHWNPSKLGFMDKEFGISASYTPWLKKLINDMSLSYVSGFKRLGENRAISASLLYFNLGEIHFTNQQGQPITDFSPKEYAFSVAYGQKLSPNLGLGVGARLIRSNLAGNVSGSSVPVRPGTSVGADIGLYYTKDLTIQAHDSKLAFGAAITNIGPRITYTDIDTLNYLPTNLRVGTAFTYHLDPFNKVMFTVDANKLLVPTPPLYDSTGRIIAGESPNKPLMEAIVSSFSDAPDGFSEELKEINYSAGIEYWYNDLFAARAGYFYEHPLKGNRQYFTMGLGVRYQVLGVDIAYLIPSQNNNPLAETLRFTLSVQFGEESGDTDNTTGTE